ncbi:Imm8 family immunity protein [Enterovibrio gelatinilyticus]|uniref:Imm8 family immunity protein n=1 Tax=Enterovibrio gelatinilyticus TaxID=2899819 RepID=UPI003B679A6B
MNVELLGISSDQLEPVDSGYPENFENFDILFELDLCFENHQADSVHFEFYVASPKAMSCRPINCFSPPTLVIEEFDWDIIKSQVSKLLNHANASKSWVEVATRLSGQIRPVSLSCFPWS